MPEISELENEIISLQKRINELKLEIEKLKPIEHSDTEIDFIFTDDKVFKYF